MHDRHPLTELPLISPPQVPDAIYSDAEAAVADLKARYAAATGFLRERFAAVMKGKAPEGRYRQVMFVVTDRAVGEGAWTLTSGGAAELLNEGSPDLLGPSRTTAFGADYRVTALIYEFRKQGEGQAVVSVPGRWNARTHLTRSGVLANLRR